MVAEMVNDYREVVQQFDFCTQHCQMTIGVLGSGNIVSLYFGDKLPSKPSFRQRFTAMAKASYLADTDGVTDFRLEQFPQMYPTFGNTDFRSPALIIRDEVGSITTDLRFVEAKKTAQKVRISGLPSSRDDRDSETYAIKLVDIVVGVEVTIFISAYYQYDVFTQHVVIRNIGSKNFQIERAYSFSWDLMDDRYQLLTLTGAWSRENNLGYTDLHQGFQGVDSKRGASGHGQNPFIALATSGANWNQGAVLGASLVYSGNFIAEAEVDMHQNTRIQIGLNPFDFSWRLGPGEEFATPEATLIYSNQGLNLLSQRYHCFYLDKLMREPLSKQPRPVVLNSWEAMFFDFDHDQIITLAKKAQRIGVEMFVMDDGWFGQRSDTTTSLGDWQPNEQKLGGKLSALIKEINEIGLKFGLWIEPEMISPKSILFQRHPDWILKDGQHLPQLTRHQYVLDLSNPQVQDFLIETLDNLLSENKIDYLKWDMNRNITDVFSGHFDHTRQTEIEHRYILGLYRVLTVTLKKYPNLLMEGCAGGGGRFDPGMLAFNTQIWASDDTDAIARLNIQQGTMLVYPPVAVSGHISMIPNQQVGRITPLKTRAIVAQQGSLGLELNLSILSQNELVQIKREIDQYKQLRKTLQFGKLAQLPVYDLMNEYAWMKSDQELIVVDHIDILVKPNTVPKRQLLVGLSQEQRFIDLNTGLIYSGDYLMAVGLPLARPQKDFFAQRWLLKKYEM
ncbi:alpha-galactosidase [Lapidilactobacillus luobeiensis]|uniref:alpha-galactosidase n=1 Tax=Lapidilactobacillus luobeiensis TaxID=2950371 RepID=UPI0021C2C862|nr:alpha-galactosidase [Lapidilactobacillus luobeiensis]